MTVKLRVPRGKSENGHEELLVPVRAGLPREATVGAFVLTALAALLIALFALTDPADFRGRSFASLVVPDAGGIRKGDPVQMRGVNIGRVRGFDIATGGVQVQLELEDDYFVPADSRAMLRSGGLLGGRTVEILPGESEGRLQDGAVLMGGSDADFLAVASGLGDRADGALARVETLLSDRTIRDVGAGAAELRTALTQLAGLAAEQRRDLAVITASLRRSAEGLEGAAAGEDLVRVVAQADTAAARLARASLSLDDVLGRMQRGEGTLGRLSSDDALYVSLTDAAASIAALAKDIREQPKRYFDVSVF